MFKKILVALAMFPMVASASVTAGTVELSGATSIGFQTGSQKEELAGQSRTTDTSAYGVAGSGLYYLNQNLGVGARLSYAVDSNKVNSVETTNTTMFIGPAVGYEQEVAPQIALFGVASVGYVSEKVAVTGTPDAKGSGFGFGLEAGAKYFIVKPVSLNAALQYDYASLSLDSTPAGTPKRTDSSFGLLLGVSVYFGGAGH